MEGITLEKLKRHGYMRLNVGAPDTRAPHAKGDFKTPSGKCEFASSAAKTGNFVVPLWRSGYEGMQPRTFVDPVPNYIAPLEAGASSPADEFRLSLVSPKPHAFLNTQFGNELSQQRRQGEQLVVIHPNDAAARQIQNGDYVQVYNKRGSFDARAELSEDVTEGIVMTNVGYWPSFTRSGTAVNSTTSSRHSNLGQAGVYSDNLVNVKKV